MAKTQSNTGVIEVTGTGSQVPIIHGLKPGWRAPSAPYNINMILSTQNTPPPPTKLPSRVGGGLLVQCHQYILPWGKPYIMTCLITMNTTNYKQSTKNYNTHLKNTKLTHFIFIIH